MKKNPLLQTSQVFFDDLVSIVKKAKQRIWIQTMIYETGPHIKLLEDILIKKAQEGVDVQIHIDWITKYYANAEIQIFPYFGTKKNAFQKANIQREEAFARLQKAGIKITQTNTPHIPFSLFPVGGRNHIKLFIVDTIACWFGGINLTEHLFKHQDLMVKYTDKVWVNRISSLFTQINTNRPKKDYIITVDPENDLYIDAGNPAQSIILKEAHQMVKNAQREITLVSPMIPDARLLSLLIQHKKIPITIITSALSDPIYRKYPPKIMWKIFQYRARKLKNIRVLHGKTKVHAKVLLVDRKEMLFGSHNFVWSGVFIGTEEIAIKTTGREMINQLSPIIEHDWNLDK